MRILYISDPFMADCDFPLVRAFQHKGVDVTYLIRLAPFSLNTSLFDIKKQVKKTGIYPATIYSELRAYEKYMDMSKVFVSNRITSTRYSWSYIKEARLLKRFIKERGYDAICAVNFLDLHKKNLYNLGDPWITIVHDPIPHSGGGDRRKKDEARKLLLALSEGVVILNENQKDAFCEKYDVPPSKVLVNRLSIYDIIRDYAPNDVKRSPYNVLFFGRIQSYKGIEYLCEAMQKVREVVPQASLTIAGSGDIYFDIGPYMRQGFINLYNHHVPMKELAILLSQCALCVCPYTDATQSGVIMTAFSLDVPVVASNVGGLGEMIEDGKNGLLVPPKDSQALAKAIISLLKNQERISQMSANIKNEYINGEKSWAHIADKYVAFFQKLINETNK